MINNLLLIDIVCQRRHTCQHTERGVPTTVENVRIRLQEAGTLKKHEF